jgi:hypothetical protein
MDAQLIHPGETYQLRRKSRGIDERVRVIELIIDERIAPISGLEYLHVEVQIQRSCGATSVVGPSKLHEIPGRTYPDRLSAEGAWMIEHKERQARRARAARKKWERARASELPSYVGSTDPVIFSHITERQVALHLGKLGIDWDYERTKFEMQRAGGFLPDFYLPELDLYVEITSQVGDVKTGKLTRMAWHHPDVRVIALDGHKIEQLLAIDSREKLLAMFESALAVEQSRAEERRAAEKRWRDRQARRKAQKRAAASAAI